MNKELIQKDKEEKAVKFYKNYIENQEKELDWMYKQDEEYYRDEIEQKELLIKGFTTILNLIQKKEKIINAMKYRVVLTEKEHRMILKMLERRSNKRYEDCVVEYFKKVVDEDE